jgi:hypothetical protein
MEKTTLQRRRDLTVVARSSGIFAKFSNTSESVLAEDTLTPQKDVNGMCLDVIPSWA